MQMPHGISQQRQEEATFCPQAALYLILATPLSLVLFLRTSPEASSFLAGYSSWHLEQLLWPLSAAALVAGVFVGFKLGFRSWKSLVVAASVPVAAAIPVLREHESWTRLLAIALCLPGWLGLVAWVPAAWRLARKPAGPARTWFLNFVLLAAAAGISFVGNALVMLSALPQLRTGHELSLLSRVAALIGGAALLPLPLYLVIRRLLPRDRQDGRVLLSVTAALLQGLAMLIFLNALRFIGGIYVTPASVLFIIVLTCPCVALFCYRVATLQSNLADGFLFFGRGLVPSWCFRKRLRVVFAVLWLFLLFAVIVIIGRAHLSYEWGFATATFYSAISIGVIWCLLTALPAWLQRSVIVLVISIISLGALTFVGRFSPGVAWTTYLKFDKNLGSVVHAYFELFPRDDPALAESRRLLEVGHDFVPADLTRVRQERLLVVEQRRPRPNVFFIVADALRAETYGGSTAQRCRFPGADWMGSRFTVYDNAWSSYNSTIGSYPAYLNGVIEPGWYHYFWSNPIHHDNVLARSCARAGYRCYNFATFSDDFTPAWPAAASVQTQGGQGLGDPGVIFPEALATLDRHKQQNPGQPAFFYLHLFNMHQPLRERPGIPMQRRGDYFMRALYEQNAAYFDLQLLAFLKGLQQRGQLENSMIVVTADHGEELFEMGGVYHGWQINPWVMHVPLFVHYPATAASHPHSGSNPRPVDLIDLAPTICESMGVRIVRDSCWQGISLLQPEPSKPRSFLLLSWKNRLVGQITFSPPRMLVLDLNSGQEEMFVSGGKGWELEPGPVPPDTLAEALNGNLEQLFAYWKMPVDRFPSATSINSSPAPFASMNAHEEKHYWKVAGAVSH